MAAQAAVLGELEARLRAPDYRGLEWDEQMRIGVEAAVSLMDAEPAMARLILVESPIAGPAAEAQHRVAVEKLTPVIDQGRKLLTGDRKLPTSVGEMALGSAMAVLTHEFYRRDEPSFESVAPDVYFALLMPFLGPIGASEKVQKTFPETIES